MQSIRSLALSLAVVGLSLGLASRASAVGFTEPTDGELGTAAAPTSLGVLPIGTHFINATSGGGDQDSITFTIAPGTFLSSIVPSSYTGPDLTSFIGLASGSSISTGGSPGNLLGYTHFGPLGGPNNIGTEIIDDIALGAGSMNAAPPHGPGIYSVWTQQAGSTATYQMNFTVTPEPTSAALLAVAALALGARRRRRV